MIFSHVLYQLSYLAQPASLMAPGRVAAGTRPSLNQVVVPRTAHRQRSRSHSRISSTGLSGDEKPALRVAARAGIETGRNRLPRCALTRALFRFDSGRAIAGAGFEPATSGL